MERILFAKGDKEQQRGVLRLLSEAFGGRYLHYYELQLESLASPSTTFLLEEGGNIIAHIQVVPYLGRIHAEGERLKCAYLYAVCTSQSMQGKGVMSQLLDSVIAEDLKKRGYQQAILVPADQGLIEYYRRFGFLLMEGGIYLRAPKEEFPAIRPGDEALFYIESAEELDSQFSPSQVITPKSKWLPFVPKQVGWMSLPIDSELLPLDTILVNPLI